VLPIGKPRGAAWKAVVSMKRHSVQCSITRYQAFKGPTKKRQQNPYQEDSGYTFPLRG